MNHERFYSSFFFLETKIIIRFFFAEYDIHFLLDFDLKKVHPKYYLFFSLSDNFMGKGEPKKDQSNIFKINRFKISQYNLNKKRNLYKKRIIDFFSNIASVRS